MEVKIVLSAADIDQAIWEYVHRLKDRDYPTLVLSPSKDTLMSRIGGVLCPLIDTLIEVEVTLHTRENKPEVTIK